MPDRTVSEQHVSPNPVGADSSKRVRHMLAEELKHRLQSNVSNWTQEISEAGTCR
jgi:hypothetical protein